MTEPTHATGEPHGEAGGILDRVKHAVGLGPKEHKLDIAEHETDVSPHSEGVETPREKAIFKKEGMQAPAKGRSKISTLDAIFQYFL